MSAIAITFQQPLDYPDAVRLQMELVSARIANAIPDAVLFLEHTPVITMGARSQAAHVLLPAAELEKRRIALHPTTRGGDATWHGPGQLVMYPILRLGDAEADAHGYLHNLEEIAIRTAAAFRVRAWRRRGMTGAWTDAGKLAAIGIRLKRWVTFHGMSFNVAPDLAGFVTIVPCGLAGERVTSLQALLGDECPVLAEVRTRMAQEFSSVCRRPWLQSADNGRLPDVLRDILDKAALPVPAQFMSVPSQPAAGASDDSG